MALSLPWLVQFEQHLQRAPERSAVICGEESLSYRALATRAAQIAQQLSKAGICNGDFVGLGLNRCLELPAALIGILKTGAAYIPIDPTYPSSRIEQMIETSKLQWIVTTRALASQFPNSKIICLEDSIDDFVTTPPVDANKDHDALYAIFTSGSTGRPKAATVFKSGFSNLLNWYIAELSLTAADRTLVISSPSFDLTQKNFFAPLATGGILVIDPEPIYDISRINALIQKHQITLLNCTPSAFYPLLDAAAVADYATLGSLRFVVLGGEPIAVPRLRQWLESAHCQAEVLNTYGPTECTDIATFYRLHRRNLDNFTFVPLGREIPNVQISICDEALTPVAVGEIGELCIAGASLGGGYLHDPQQTAEVFQNSLYRSGDLAKLHPSGVFEFRGRADHQVKINGFRIELAEIELALQQHPAVREAAVIVQQDRLLAFIQGEIPLRTLRDFLATRLPHYMIPSSFHWLEKFPHTPNGKLDRLALSQAASLPSPAPISGISMLSKVLALWSEVLGQTIADSTTNFFDLGGNSIHLAIIHVRLMKMTDRQFPITELFALPNAQAIADFLSSPSATITKLEAPARAQFVQASFNQFRRSSSR